MKAYLIDTENINLDIFLSSNIAKKKKNFFYIVGNDIQKLSLKSLKALYKNKFKVYNFEKASKDYADKIILTLLGIISKKKKIKKIYIVSNDKIFENLAYVKQICKKSVNVIKLNTENSQKSEKAESKMQIFFNNNKEKIEKLAAEFDGKLADFHNQLVKTYGRDGFKIYHYLKEKRTLKIFAKTPKNQSEELVKKQNIKSNHIQK